MNRWHSPPAELYSLVEHTPATVLLESARPPDSTADTACHSTVTRLFTAPLRVCAAHRLAELPALFAAVESAVAQGLFAAGYFAYECGAFFEPTTAPPLEPEPAAPIAWAGIYHPPILFDHRTGTFLPGEPPALAQFRPSASQPLAPLETTLAITEAQYAQRIAAIQEKIRAGDIYQLNFTIPLRLHAPGGSAALYQSLRVRQPAPYGAFLHSEPHHRILSFSPELFFRLDEAAGARRITTRPMKGTAPRGRTTAEDQNLSDWLRHDPKNRAENVMIVDLLRNDLGRISHFGSVRTQHLFAVERYPTLWQMTSTVTANLRPQVTFQQIFRALFPCGSITGAPKVRAMQLIAEFEQPPRGVYTGAIGFFSKQETVFSVAIRTIELHGHTGSMGVGSGIVIDSGPAAEFRECLLKAKFLTTATSSPASPATGDFSLVETMLSTSALEIPLLELHLQRLTDSANYFTFPFNRAAIVSALHTHLQSHRPNPTPANSPTRHPRATGANLPLQFKVRLLLNHEGTIQITSELLPAQTSTPLRIRIAAPRVDPADPMYFHKTTLRPLYAAEFQAAQQAGYDDVLFLNLRDEVTECAIHNIFLEKDGRLLTPPIASGLLPGVYRRHILATRPSAAESILTLADLRHADAIYLTNAVRGLRPALIDWNHLAPDL